METVFKIQLLFFTVCFISCSSHRSVLEKTIHSDPWLKSVASSPEHEVQIIYTRVDKKNKKFVSQHYHVDPDRYFYPASTVKMPVAILALHRINQLKEDGIEISKKDNMLTAGLNDKLIPAFTDATTENNKPNIERYIQKIFAVSDNDAFNRLYELLGPDYINAELRRMRVFEKSVICHRLSILGLTKDDQLHTNNVRFFRNNKLIYDVPERQASVLWKHYAKDVMKGVGYINEADSLVCQPFDFGNKNFYTLKEMEGTLQRILFPQYFSPDQRFNLTEDDYSFLKKSMSDLPETYSFYRNNSDYYDSYVKFFMFGDSKDHMPEQIKIYNKVGNAYGYLIDCAYIENKQKDIGFFLTAVIHVNKNKIYNDGKYEYDETGLPFLARLGKVMYEYELQQHKK